MKKLLACNGVSFKYENNFVLDNVSFEIIDGDFIVLIGPNGGGKSTLAKLITRLLIPTSGKITYPNKHLFNQNSIIGYLSQDTSINKYFPIQALDIVLMGFMQNRLFGNRISKDSINKALSIMDALFIKDIAYTRFLDLSGGQQQKLLIARALCGSPKLIIFDEPTSNIDIPSQQAIVKLLKDLSKTHTILVITHDSSIFIKYASNVLFVNREVHSYDPSNALLNKDCNNFLKNKYEYL